MNELVLDKNERVDSFLLRKGINSRRSNAYVILHEDPKLGKLLSYDPHLGQLRFRPEEQAEWQPFSSSIAAMISMASIRAYDVEITDREIQAVFRNKQVSPLTEALLGLKWDGVERMRSWLSTYLGAEASETNACRGEKWIFEAVNRGICPGWDISNVLVLYGPQGGGKSKVVEILGNAVIPGYAGRVEVWSMKSAKDWTHQGWIVEVDDGRATTRRRQLYEQMVLKRQDEVRLPYELIGSTIQRASAYIETTSDAKHAKQLDEMERYYVVQVGDMDLEALQRDAKQLWAEAAHKSHARKQVK